MRGSIDIMKKEEGQIRSDEDVVAVLRISTSDSWVLDGEFG